MRRAALIVVTAIVTLAACGDDQGATPETSGPAEISLVSVAPPSTVPKPEVELPDEAPTELTPTVITEGAGIEAEAGDGVLVRYVGVGFETGEEFDSNFGGEPLPVVLGQGRVIAGWEEGLVGVQAGERIQLDIPADLAYGPSSSATTTAGSEGSAETTAPAPTGPPTGPLSFVIDVLAVVEPTDPAAAPTDEEIPTLCPRPATATTTAETVTAETTPATTGDTSATSAPSSATTAAATATTGPTNGVCDVHVTEVVTDDITVGDGPTARLGQMAIMHFVLARADNGVVLRTSWDDGQPSQLPLVPGAEMSGMITGIEGMQVGGRRAITVPYREAFGERGFPTAGLPARTDVVVIVDLLGVYT